MRRIPATILAACALALAVAGPQGLAHALAVSYAPGWNLVAGPDGSHLRGAGGNIYTLQPGDAGYEVFPASTPLRGGVGYWAYFAAGGSLDASTGGGPQRINLVPGSWAIVGNPMAATDVAVSGADSVLTYDPAAGYQNTTTIPAGRGAWVMAQGEIALSTAIAPTPLQAAPPASAVPAAGAERISGSLAIEGRPAPSGTEVDLYAGNTVCASAATTAAGRYTLDAGGACGAPGSSLQFGVVPGFGDGWRLADSVPFQPGTPGRHDLSVDLKALAPDATNVPWTNTRWANPSTIHFSVCDDLDAASSTAVQGALAQWQDAARSEGLRINVVPDNSSAICDVDAPGIGIVVDSLDDPNALAATGYFDANGHACRKDVPCNVFSAVIVINSDSDSFDSLDPLDAANVIAHEMGHALGLGHAFRCDGGTIMWADEKCRYPLAAIGVDDVASLNAKIAGTRLQKSSAAAGDADAADAGAAVNYASAGAGDADVLHYAGSRAASFGAMIAAVRADGDR